MVHMDRPLDPRRNKSMKYVMNFPLTSNKEQCDMRPTKHKKLQSIICLDQGTNKTNDTKTIEKIRNNPMILE